MKHRLAISGLAAALALWAPGAMAQSGDPDRIDRQLALGHAAAIEAAWSMVAARIAVTDAGNLWEDEWDGLSDPATGNWWLDSWTRRGLSARYCAGVLAVYANQAELKGVGRDQRAVQVAPVAYANERSGLHLVTRNSRLYTGAHGRSDGALPACMPVLSTTGDRVALISAVDDPKTTAAGLRWEEEDRNVACPVASDTGSLTERRRIPVQVTAITNCPATEPNCNDLREFVTGTPAWPEDCTARETMLSATPPTLPVNAACSDWFRWRSECQIVYAAAPPAADIPDSVINWEPGAVHSWTSACACPSGQTGSCTENWEQDTEIRIFVLRPGVPELRTRQPARGIAGRRRLVRTDENCTLNYVNEGGNSGDDHGGADDGGSTGGGSTEGVGEQDTVNDDGDFSTEDDGTDDDSVGGPPTGCGCSEPPGDDNDNDNGNANGGGGDGKPIVLDLDGDGVELVPLKDSTARFDINGDGYREHMAWAAPHDGFLVFDKNGDGVIEDKDELSFLAYVESAQTDLEGLRYFDTDGDGQLDPDDAEWGMFRVWQDLDQDGESAVGELRSLDEAGIRSVGLTSDSVKREVAGSTVYGEGVYVGRHGQRAFWDVMLRIAPRVE